MIERAKAYAIEAHGDQVRKYTGEPYWHHCEAVANRVALLTDDPETIVAAWLHDVVEDTVVTSRDIRVEFGERVGDLVLGLTDVYTPQAYPDWNRARRKQAEAERLSRCSPYVRLVKLCDVMDNAQSIEAEGGGFAKVWAAEKRVLVMLLLDRLP